MRTSSSKMKGDELESNSFDGHCHTGEYAERQSTTSGSTKNETAAANHCAPSSPSTSSGYVSIARSTTTPLSQGKKYIDIQLLTREHLYLAVDVKCKVGDVYRYVCAHIGLNCVTLFGLAHYIENEYRFCDLDERLPKYSPTKTWQKAPGWGTDLVGNPSVILYLRVHTYVDYVRLINCPISLLHYYLQLRENVRIQWEPGWVTEERCFEAAALALQADFGDCRPDEHKTAYFRADSYFPMWVVNLRGLDYVQQHVPSMHNDLEGLDQHEAQIRYCREASRPPCPVNMHLYRLRRNKADSLETIYLGVAARGLELFEQKPSGDRQHLNSFLWSKISKLAFDRKKFTLASLDGQRMVLYTSSDEKSRYLLNFCRSVHQNIIRLQTSIVEAKKREAEEKKQFRESYIYSDAADLNWVRKADTKIGQWGLYEYNAVPSSASTTSINNFTLTMATTNPSNPSNGGVGICCGGGGGQRVSLVSDASSNTTSGIVSDRQHTHEDSENENDGDVDFEITTGCDSSPLVSELSLATTGTSLPHCTNGGQNSQQASPVCGSGIADNQERVVCVNDASETTGPSAGRNEPYFACECVLEGDNEEVDPGEGSSVGPCSDRTVTAAADDTQSTETTSTTGKLEDLCVENDLPGAAATADASSLDGRNRACSSNQPSKRNSVVSISNAGNVSIAELRRLTLQDYDRQSSIPKRRASPPILIHPPPPSNLEETSRGEIVNTNDVALKSLSTQTSETLGTSTKEHKNVNAGMNASTGKSHYQGSLELLHNDIVTTNPLASSWNAGGSKSYRIIASQASHDGSQNADAAALIRNRFTPSPPRMESLVVEPGPPPRYPYDVEIAVSNKIAQSYSLSHLPSSSAPLGAAGVSPSLAECPHEHPERRLQRTSVDGLPNYEEALQYKAELGRRAAASTVVDPAANVPWLHTSTSRRWPTVSGINPEILDQLIAARGTRRLQQAQSEPGLAGPYYAGSDEYPMVRRCCYADGTPMDSFLNPFSCLYYGPGGPAGFDGAAAGAGAYRSLSTYQLATAGSAGRTCSCQQPFGPPPPVFHHPHHHFHSSYGQYMNNHLLSPACTPSGLYVKQPRAQLRSLARTSAGHRAYAADCQQPSSQLLYSGSKPSHNGVSNKAVARVHSMYEAAKADEVRRSLEYEYYRRFEQQVVQNTRRELRKQQVELERQLGSSLNDPGCHAAKASLHLPDNNHNHLHSNGIDQGAHESGKRGRYCESCQENHTAGKIDLDQLKDIIRSQNVDLPLMRALCNDKTWEQQQQRANEVTAQTVSDDAAAHPLLRQKKQPPSRTDRKPPTEVAPFEYLPTNCGRPVTWHESFNESPQVVGMSSWPPCEFSYDH